MIEYIKLAPRIFVCACGGLETHFNHVIMFARPFGEDGVVETTTVDQRGRVSKTILDRSSPGADDVYRSRRHSIQLVGTCETCGKKSVIRIIQYKGQTLIDALYESDL